MKAKRVAATVGLTLLAAFAWTQCAPRDELFSLASEDISLRLDRLDCLDQNDATGSDDEVYILVSWTDTEKHSRRLPANGGSWRMCGSDEFEPSPLLKTSIAPREQRKIHIEVAEDDSHADRVSNQIDDALAHFELLFSLGKGGALQTEVTPLPIQDNNAVAMLPLVDLELDEAARSVVFRSVYRNSDGGVHYEGQITW